jgi:hypothetical protein
LPHFSDEERTDAMRFDVVNWEDLKLAVSELDKTEEPKVIVFNTPGGIFHRFVINQFGVEKEECDASGRSRQL